MNTPANRILYLQRTAGNQAVSRLMKSRALQAKLRIGQPGDVYEQEADRVADEVMRMPELRVLRQVEEEEEEEEELVQTKPIAEQIMPLVQRWEEEEEKIPTKPLAEQITPLVQRQVEEEEEEEILQTNQVSNHTPEVTTDLESRINSLKCGGQPLPETVRTFFEPRFGYDFSQVRMHTDTGAAKSARVLNARAYAVGRDIMFGSGQYAPETSGGRRLLAHELTHVVQQTTPQASQPVRLNAIVQQTCDESRRQRAGILARQIYTLFGNRRISDQVRRQSAPQGLIESAMGAFYEAEDILPGASETVQQEGVDMSDTQAKTTQSHDADKTHDRDRRPESPTQEQGMAGEAISFGPILGSSAMDLPVENHAALLGDPRFSHSINALQRAGMLSLIQRTYGNAHVQQVVDHIQASRDEEYSDEKLHDKPGKRLVADQITHVVGQEARPFGTFSLQGSTIQRQVPQRRVPKAVPAAGELHSYLVGRRSTSSKRRKLDKVKKHIGANKGKALRAIEVNYNHIYDLYMVRHAKGTKVEFWTLTDIKSEKWVETSPLRTDLKNALGAEAGPFINKLESTTRLKPLTKKEISEAILSKDKRNIAKERARGNQRILAQWLFNDKNWAYLASNVGKWNRTTLVGFFELPSQYQIMIWPMNKADHKKGDKAYVTDIEGLIANVNKTIGSLRHIIVVLRGAGLASADLRPETKLCAITLLEIRGRLRELENHTDQRLRKFIRYKFIWTKKPPTNTNDFLK
ncbi:MAG: DUF4157 domain-containing protein [candidate division Zixibacteria bacterium]|nr:DUF4157 domain-containing protein [candidate division Zixibacteria bacterium]